jgi:signal transduction histidine kinase
MWLDKQTGHRSKNNSKVDLLFIIIIMIVTYYVASSFELAETWLEWTVSREHYQLDELIFVLLSLSFSLMWYSHRRYKELQNTLQHNIIISNTLENKNKEISTLLSENRSLISHITHAREVERNELASELHDIFGQHLAAIEVNATVASNYSKDNEKLSPILKNIHVSAHRLIQVTRSKLRSIKPPNLDVIGLTDSINELMSQWTHSFPDYQVDIELDINDDWIKYDTALTVYRCLQEGLSNIVKHAIASEISIKITTETTASNQKTLWLVLKDNGVGISSNVSVHSGLGLIGMRERITAISGHLSIYPAETTGTVLIIKLPIHSTTLI